jgi:hypothetical protein
MIARQQPPYCHQPPEKSSEVMPRISMLCTKKFTAFTFLAPDAIAENLSHREKV